MTRRPDSKSHGSHERWLVSYADFITLLFAFFVVLYASSKADQKKQRQVSEAIDSAFHALGMFPDAARKLDALKNISAISRDEPISPVNLVMGEEVLAPARVKEDLEHIQKQLQRMLSNEIATHTVSIHMGKDGLVISLREAGFFSTGSAIPHPGTVPLLKRIAATLSKTPYDLRVEGHTDNVPIHNEAFDSNWELSAARATRIARIFLVTEVEGERAIPADRLSAAGFAEFHPVASNGTLAGRAENRRVDLIVLPRTQVNLAMPEADASKTNWHRITE